MRVRAFVRVHTCHLRWKEPLSERTPWKRWRGLSQPPGLVCELFPALLFTSPKFFVLLGEAAPAAPQMLFIFSCEGLVTVQGVVYPV